MCAGARLCAHFSRSTHTMIFYWFWICRSRETALTKTVLGQDLFFSEVFHHLSIARLTTPNLWMKIQCGRRIAGAFFLARIARVPSLGPAVWLRSDRASFLLQKQKQRWCM